VFIDKTHILWAVGVLAAAGAAWLVWAVVRPVYGTFATSFWYGLAGCLCCLAANLLALRSKLAGRKIKLGVWQKIHVWVGSLSAPIILFHAGGDWGCYAGHWLIEVYWAIVVSGLVALVCHQEGPLVKFGDRGGKALVAARWIWVLKEAALFVHVPLTGAFWPLLLMHAWGKVFY
jgi:peptidoglycan/LPS O-acetylase OafA/YrhL